MAGTAGGHAARPAGQPGRRLPVPVCRVARTHRGRRCRGEAASGHQEPNRQTFSGYRLHGVRCARPSLIAAISLAPANASGRAVLPEVLDCALGGDP